MLSLCVSGGPSRAQTPAAAAPTSPVPAAVEAGAAAPPAGTVSVAAQFSSDQGPIRSGLEWRIFRLMPDGASALQERSKQNTPVFKLDRGDYIVHVAYGFASASKRLTVGETPVTEKFTLAAGALRLAATVGDQPIPRAKVNYTIYVPAAGDPEGHQLASGIRSGEAVRLAEGVYHIVSTYGDTNATVRADIKVESGKLTDATLRHRAATMTLKLVETAGGEALADTNWSVFSPGGDIVQESVGAFATMTLAEGLYSVVARHAGKTYARDFKVDTGRDGDVEVLAKDSQ
ncbi:hypothetical protein SAMN05444161_0461 [Rhizobiales bacterium GAS191]|jgi:hypothetical protein|nr:hypothetical protein SAMN05519103_07948 [Rhizobiales bacterium GAS113]SEC07871.1 hypothetical protein SAMN05444161_0461 [Rhizobiales bacterium GAS191]SED12175.1 hypothetical protein SAMN05519104_2840 [Rhizobiales bacterium GAS188]